MACELIYYQWHNTFLLNGGFPIEDQQSIINLSIMTESAPTEESDIEYLDWKAIWDNSMLLQNTLYAICKEKSSTDYEFQIKYDVYERLMKSYTRWGYGGQIVAFAGLVRYCLKGTKPGRKLGLGGLYVYWINHFFTLGAYVGVSMNLPWAMDQVTISKDYSLGRQVQYMITQLKLRERQRAENQPYISDRELSHLMNAQRNQQSPEKQSSYVANDYFELNKHRYLDQYNAVGENLQLPYLDSFLTRYLYHSFRRWSVRVGQWLGVVEE